MNTATVTATPVLPALSPSRWSLALFTVSSLLAAGALLISAALLDVSRRIERLG